MQVKSQRVGNKAKGWISNQVFQENKARQIFRKTNIWTNEIRPFALLPTNIWWVLVFMQLNTIQTQGLIRNVLLVQN